MSLTALFKQLNLVGVKVDPKRMVRIMDCLSTPRMPHLAFHYVKMLVVKTRL